ncbi:MAG: hypothetical protein PHC64_08605 [Candidatus Gastranaerophilales bacterium]|nr:hypothetical protein [Candidatus Gastranaerophilales bacterium]
MQYKNEPLMMEKIIAALTYITFGFAGFIWLLIGIFTKNNIRPYLKYHIFQSIFLSIAYFLLGAFLGLIMNILSVIPLVNQLVLQLTFYLNAPIIFGFSLIQTLVYAVILYLVVTSFQGQYSYLPWISEIIKANVRNG